MSGLVMLTAALGVGQTGLKLDRPEGAIRIATFNVSLNRDEPGGLIRDLSTPDNVQARNVAEVVQRVAPDVLLLNEFDYDADGEAARLFRENYLEVSQRGAEPIVYPYAFSDEVNTGLPSGRDLNKDGRRGGASGTREYAEDAIGYGTHPGQYGMLLLSKYPIDVENVTTFQKLLWRDMPGARLPRREDGSAWYDEGDLEVLRLSSKSHWDAPIRIGDRTLRVLASHPTPPAFDGPERRNVLRNHDEIRVWADHLTGGEAAAYLRKGYSGKREPSTPETFVIMGDQNADPNDATNELASIRQLLDHPRVNGTFAPRSPGGRPAAEAQGGANARHVGPPEEDTADFNDRAVGNLRVDYVLPSKDLKVAGGGVFWPAPGDPLARLVEMEPEPATSDHRLVWLDAILP